MRARHTVKVTANFERNLESIEAFLLEAGAPQVYDALLDELLGTVLPNLESFPEMGRLFLTKSPGSVEVANGIDRLTGQLQAISREGTLREYAMTHHLMLYASADTTVYLLSIRHHRQLSFDFPAYSS